MGNVAGTGMIGALNARPASVSFVANGVAARNSRNWSADKVRPLEQIPFVTRPDAHVVAELLHLFLGHQPGVIVFVAGERQSHALDGVGDETSRLIAQSIRIAKMLDQGVDAMTAEIGHQGAQFGVGERIDDGGAGAGAAEIGEQT